MDADSPDYSKSAAGKAKKAADDAGHSWYSPEIPVAKQFFNYMDGVSGVEVPVSLQQQPYTAPYDGDKGLPITNWIKNTTKPEDTKDNPFAIATAQAQEQGYQNFSAGTQGDKQRKKIAEALKR